jgi:hypothetical protein
MKRSKRLSAISRKRSLRAFQKMRKVCCGTRGGFCVPNIKKVKDKILREAHESAYSIHPGGNKMYHDLKATYWWYEMKRDVVEYVALCDTCQRVKVEHQ